MPLCLEGDWNIDSITIMCLSYGSFLIVSFVYYFSNLYPPLQLAMSSLTFIHPSFIITIGQFLICPDPFNNASKDTDQNESNFSTVWNQYDADYGSLSSTNHNASSLYATLLLLWLILRLSKGVGVDWSINVCSNVKCVQINSRLSLIHSKIWCMNKAPCLVLIRARSSSTQSACGFLSSLIISYKCLTVLSIIIIILSHVVWPAESDCLWAGKRVVVTRYHDSLCIYMLRKSAQVLIIPLTCQLSFHCFLTLIIIIIAALEIRRVLRSINLW